MSGPIRADHVGSLLRPANLLRAREDFAHGTISRDALREVEDQAILSAIEGQQRAGVQVFTDGEFRRASWLTDMASSVDGFLPQSRNVEWRGLSGDRQTEASTSNVVGGRLAARGRLTDEQMAFVKAHAPGPIKMTLPAPSNFWVVSWKAGVSDQAYSSRSEMLADVVAILRDEVQALVREGVSYIQLDAPFYGVFIDPQHRSTLLANGVDPDAALHEVIAADSAVVAGLPSDVVTALHICRGNSRSRWLYEGSYEPIAEALFGGLGVSAFLLEYDSPRDGDFSPLRYLSSGKTAVLGLVTSKEAELESVDSLRRRIDEASGVVPLEQLALSPQCGFASVASGNLLSEADQWKKLALVAETARRVWG